MSADPWADVPDVELPQWALRSKIKYPDPAPEMTARMWANLRAARAARNANSEDEEEYEIKITQEAEEFDEPCSPLAAYVKLAHAHGWTIESLAHSFAFQRGKAFLSGAHEGTVRPDLHIECQWVHLTRGVHRVSVGYDIVNDTVRSATTVRRFDGGRIADRELKNLIKGTA